METVWHLILIAIFGSYGLRKLAEVVDPEGKIAVAARAGLVAWITRKLQ